MRASLLLPWLLPACLAPVCLAGEPGDVQTPRGFLKELGVADAAAPVMSTRQDFAPLLSPALRNWGTGNFSIPFAAEERRLDAERSVYTRALSIQWQHRADAENRYTVSARRDNAKTSDAEPATASGLVASVAWQRTLNADTRLTSRLLLGDEESRTQPNSPWGRRYYGMEVEGRYQLWERHAPFSSFSGQRSGYDAPDGLSWMNSNGRRENRSRFAAGWAYQPLPNWDFRAEANLRLSEDALDPADNDRSRIYFSTQYGFR